MRTKLKKIIIHILYKVYKIVRRPILWYQKKFNIKTCGVRVLIMYQNKVVLVKHWYNGLHVPPGGGIKKSETPEYAAIREIKEETGLDIKQLDYLLGVYSNTKEGKNDTVYCFVVHLEEEPVFSKRFNIEIASIGLFDIADLPQSVSSATRQRLVEYQNKDITEEVRIWS